jgi:glycosyltransferase involved in cell wall biosynthesis
MTEQPKVSVIVPVYNAAKWLPTTFCSFEGQTYSNVEWILVDDGSQDRSAELCETWCSADISRRCLVRKENGGASSARNVGLGYATGEYVLFWDSDDEQDGAAIAKMIASVVERDDVAVCAIRRVGPDGSYRDLFTCDRHEAVSTQALAEWLRGGGVYGTLFKIDTAEDSRRERN